MRVVLLLTALMFSAAALSGEACARLVGKSFFVDVISDEPPLTFYEKTDSGVRFDTLSRGERLTVTALMPSASSIFGEIQTEDARTVGISCSTFLQAMNPDSALRSIYQSDAPDLEHALAEYKAKKRAFAAEARRKHFAAQAAENARTENQAKESEQLEAERIARGGVRIGMTEAQALASSWGSPDKRNHTFVAGGDRQQWVYGGEYYLYFSDGILTSVQTSHPDSGYFRVAR